MGIFFYFSLQSFFCPEAARAKTLLRIKTTEAIEPKYLSDPKNLRSYISILDTGVSFGERDNICLCL